MQARDVMTTKLVTATPDTTVQEIARRLVARRISALPVVDEDGRIVGLVSEGDLMRRHELGTERHRSWWLALLAGAEDVARDFTRSHGLRAEDVMTRTVVTVAEETPLEEIAALLERRRIKRVPVVRDGKLVGIVSRADLLHALAAARPSRAASASDRKIRAALERAIGEAGIRAHYLKIVVHRGVVQLWGTLVSEEEQHALKVAAETTRGVKRVEDNTVVMEPEVRAQLGGV
ncbi:MAG TPA: CBS domain-containing protein [Burkholderiaceae bacterium]|nr:CBS domain-containing protein [Burkholderiaceae bacterium]